MIYDYTHQIHRYFGLEQALVKIPELLLQPWEDGLYTEGSLEITVASYIPQQFQHSFSSYKEKTVFYTVLEGSELVVTGYRAQRIESSGVSASIQAKPGRFMLFLPGEIFCTSLLEHDQEGFVRSMKVVFS